MSENLPATKTAGDVTGTAEDRGIHQVGDVSAYTPEQRDRLRAVQNIGDASDADLYVLGEVARRAGLDPLLKEIYLVGRRTKVKGYRGETDRWETVFSVQVGIEGFRKVLQRFAKEKNAPFHTETVYYDDAGNSRPIWLRSAGHHPAAVQVTVTVGDSSVTNSVVWEEFAQTTKDGEPTKMWNDKPSLMLAKCAEAGAIRRICPLTAGMYEPAEMGPRHVELVRADQSPERGEGTRGALNALTSRISHSTEDAPVDVEAEDHPDQSPIDSILASLLESPDREELTARVDIAKGAGLSEADLARVSEAANARWSELQGGEA